jgi:hypothetical protein
MVIGRRMGRRGAQIAVLAMTCTLSVLLVARAASAGIVGGIWKFNDGSGQTIPDSSGNNNTATLGSTPGPDANDPTWVQGVTATRKALHFDGQDFVTVPDSPSLSSAKVTVSAVVRAAASPGNFRYVVAKGAFRCSFASYGLYTGSNGGLEFYISNGTDSYTVSPDAGTAVWDGRWHLVTGTYDGASVRLYVDGKQVGTGVQSTITLPSGTPDDARLAFGNYLGPCPSSLGFVGEIQAVAVLQDVLPRLTL